jgi:thiol-activated cytolysin
MKSLRSHAVVFFLACAAACGVTPAEGTKEPTAEPNVDQSTTPNPEGKAIDDFIGGIPALAVADPQPKTEVACTTNCPEPHQDGAMYCTYRRYTETARFDRFVAFQPNSATLWPGSIVRGKDAQDGMLTPVGVKQAPVTFSFSLENITASPVGKMENPSLSAFREVRNAILANELTGATPASFDFQVTQVRSATDLSLALGGGVKWPGGSSVAGSFDFSSHLKMTKVVVNFTQAYYTIDVDTPVKPQDFFHNTTKLDEIKKYVDSTSPPLYVQSITYGRRVIFTVETDETAENIKAALEATYKGALKANGKVDASYQQMLEKSKITAFVLGGSGAAATGAVTGFEGLVKYITEGGDFSKNSPGAPISYKLAYLDNEVAKLAFTTEYTEKVCKKNRATLKIELSQIDHVGGDDNGDQIELRGNVGVRYPTVASPKVSCDAGGAQATLWSLTGDSHVKVTKKSSYKPNSPVVIYVHDVPIDADDRQICLSGNLVEVDWPSELSPDDDLGSAKLPIHYGDGWEGEQVLHFAGKGDLAVDVRVKVTVQ